MITIIIDEARNCPIIKPCLESRIQSSLIAGLPLDPDTHIEIPNIIIVKFYVIIVIIILDS